MKARQGIAREECSAGPDHKDTYEVLVRRWGEGGEAYLKICRRKKKSKELSESLNK